MKLYSDKSTVKMAKVSSRFVKHGVIGIFECDNDHNSYQTWPSPQVTGLLF